MTAGLKAVCETGDSGKLTKALTVESQERFGGAYIGRDRARDLAVNVVLPFLDALDQPAGTGSFLEIYRKFGKLQDNELTKEMAHRLLIPAWRGVADSARRQQGLIQLQRLLAGAS